MVFVRERLRRLEADVEHLKTWSGPGQAAALSDSVRELRGEFKIMLKNQKAMQSTLEQHSTLLDQHTETLNQHTETLNQHTETLNQHTETLNQHTETLNQHTEKLDTILELLSRK
jgi:ABC-type transporter Mla subunit MlaD